MPDIQLFLCGSIEETTLNNYVDLLAERTASIEAHIDRDELQTLQAENKRLQRKIIQLKNSSLKKIFEFLPVFFNDFWGYMRPEDLTALTGTIRVPKMPIGTSAPDDTSVLAMKQKIMALEPSDRHLLTRFCHAILHTRKLKLHPEFRVLFADKDEQAISTLAQRLKSGASQGFNHKLTALCRIGLAIAYADGELNQEKLRKIGMFVGICMGENATSFIENNLHPLFLTFTSKNAGRSDIGDLKLAIQLALIVKLPKEDIDDMVDFIASTEGPVSVKEQMLIEHWWRMSPEDYYFSRCFP